MAGFIRRDPLKKRGFRLLSARFGSNVGMRFSFPFLETKVLLGGNPIRGPWGSSSIQTRLNRQFPFEPEHDEQS